ncbi:unnamed protein product [Rotaria socialis]|uniref:Major facilitator superfamily (MFS) profile domain-containing protein n=2 Tax=Rotaria socialis TaxID=392032 RepID=A0A820RZ18_9BILA|nr:unnamed protein product [Rotaria socialis]CAF4198812.1 unnamed protein product [Rotaria socialis]CAF4276150.1 unnamed protein product [Rotaria socialis]CAF4445211.1 unnamed protein product [Rotaria socialis]CAF4490401.1 unnamed protein product [Rotaria socialis]
MSFGKSRTVTLCSLANFINAADRAIMPIAIIPMAKELNWNLPLQGYILSSFPIGYLTSQLFAHIFVRRFGTKAVLALAVFTWSLVTFATPFLAPLPFLLIFSRIALGFGEGLALPTIFHVFSNYVPMEERSRSFSYLIALGSVGQTFAALICPHIAWRTVFFFFGFIGFLWTFLWIVSYRDLNLNIGNVGADEAFLHPSSKLGNKSYRWIEFISHWPLWAIYIAHFSMNWSSYIVMVWLPSYLTKTFDADPTNLSFTAFPYVMNCLLGVAAGHFADSLIQNRWTVLSVRRLMTAIGLLGPALFMLLFISVDNLLLAVVFISISMGLSACNSAGHLSNHADIAPNHAGITFAISNTLATIPGILAGPVTAELVVASHGRWFPVFILASGVNFMAKSKRSKHMRAMRKLLRDKLSKKDEAKRLASMKKDTFIPAKNDSLDDDKEMQISTNTTTEYNVRTLKNKDGQFPSWLSGRQRKRLQAKQAVVKRIAKNKKSKTPGKKQKKKITLNTSDAMLT